MYLMRTFQSHTIFDKSGQRSVDWGFFSHFVMTEVKNGLCENVKAVNESCSLLLFHLSLTPCATWYRVTQLVLWFSPDF